MTPRILIFMVLSTLGASASFADATLPQLQNLNLSQAQSAVETFTADVAFRPVEPASAYGKYWGLSFGVIGIATSAKRIENDLGVTGLSVLPGGDIFIGVQAPFGLGLELGMLPSLNVNGLKARKIGADLKWTVNEAVLKSLPFDVALRGMLTSVDLSYEEAIGPAKDTIALKSTVLGTNLSLSKRLFYIFEPYVGLGYIHQSSTLSNNGTISLFNNTVSLSNSWDHSGGSAWFYAGLQLRLVVPTISMQYDSMFGVGSASAKIGFKF